MAAPALQEQVDALEKILVLRERRWATKTHAGKLRIEAEERKLVIAALGWDPEPGMAAERYAATTSEMVRWLERDVTIGLSRK